MISVLIPTYHWNVAPLVTELHQQLQVANIPFEIISIDDGSNSDFTVENNKINQLPNSTFFSLKENIGRSALRNLLIKKSNYDWLLFLDCDVLPTSKKFIQNYINAIKTSFLVVVGGIAYTNNNSHFLRWKFGKKSEEVSAEVRNTNPYKYFFTANFFIHKSVTAQLQFDENLTQYGYEDLLFAKEIEQLNTAVHHINNPVFHLGIDDNTRFINKTKQALTNMVFLLKLNKISFNDTRISLVYKKLRFYGIIPFFSWLIPFFEKKAVKNSSLIMYNLFRISYLHKILKQHQ